MESALADALIGRMLDGRYHVRSRIARGGMATVYLATDTRLDRLVALKVMHAELARDEEFVGRFIGEAKSVARLSHPNIVAVFDQGSDGHYLYLAMEYVPGRTLRSLLRERGWFPYGEALEIMDPILSGLAAAHRSGIVHRDVKPENVLLTADGRVKVVDFGLARAQAATGQTRAGLIIGTVAYIAPEQVTGGVTDFRTDVYSAGVMLFEMLTGRQPHTGESPLAVAYRHVNEDIPAPAAYVGGIPPTVNQLVLAATSRSPQRRPTDAGTFLRAVRMLRGVGDEGDMLTVAWSEPAGADGFDEPDESPGASHTMVFGAGPGYGGPGQLTGYPTEPAYSDHEPFLQRWLFSKRLGLIAIGAAAVVAIGAGAWWLTSGRYAPLPSVAGQPLAKAENILRSDGFRAQEGTLVADDDVAKGEVISISPSGRAAGGALITLTVSSGPRMISVPSVSGQSSLTAAENVLRNAGLTVATTPKKVAVSGEPVGTVVGTTPASGTLWPQTRPVYVDVAAGIPLPPLVGQNISAIQQWAGQNNIQLNTVNEPSSQPSGIIVSQSPAAGAPVAPGQTVTVHVSSGPPMVTIPDVRGEHFAQAQQQLEKLGFQVNGQQFGPGDTVISTSPSGSAQQGSTITVYYGGFGFSGF
jgi:eukaryotic-like serine/threonine-protein kinase